MRKARWKFVGPGLLALVALTAGVGTSLSPPEGAGAHPATGVGSCTLKNWNPNGDPEDAKDLPQGQRPQTYKRATTTTAPAPPSPPRAPSSRGSRSRATSMSTTSTRS